MILEIARFWASIAHYNPERDRYEIHGVFDPLTGAVESEAASLESVIQEMLLTTSSERQGRAIDHDQAASMEKKKREGYF